MVCDVLNGFQNKMQTINNDLINSCKKTCYSMGGRHDRSATYPIVPSEHPVSITSGLHEHYMVHNEQLFSAVKPKPWLNNYKKQKFKRYSTHFLIRDFKTGSFFLN